jgi:hypothetical protein
MRPPPNVDERKAFLTLDGREAVIERSRHSQPAQLKIPYPILILYFETLSRKLLSG